MPQCHHLVRSNPLWRTSEMVLLPSTHIYCNWCPYFYIIATSAFSYALCIKNWAICISKWRLFLNYRIYTYHHRQKTLATFESQQCITLNDADDFTALQIKCSLSSLQELWHVVMNTGMGTRTGLQAWVWQAWVRVSIFSPVGKPTPVSRVCGFVSSGVWNFLSVYNWRPMQAYDSQWRPTQANSGQRRPTRPQQPVGNQDRPKQCDTSFGPGMFLFYLLFFHYWYKY